MTTAPDMSIAIGGAKRELEAPGWARVRRLQLIRREVREFMAPSSLEALFAYAERVVEGGLDTTREKQTTARAYVTVMVTIDLSRCAELFRDRADAATAERVAELIGDHEWVRRKLVELARPELARISGLAAGKLRVMMDMRVRAESTRVYIDGDAVATLLPRREALR